MKPIYYKTKNEEYFKLELKDDISSRDMDTILDVISESEFVSAEEFENSVRDKMTIKIMDRTEQYELGYMICNEIPIYTNMPDYMLN